MVSRNNARGSQWSQWDLHFHTPSSGSDYENKSITNKQIIEKLISENISVVAITDHQVIDIDRIRELQALSKGRLTIFPGIEFKDEHGGKPIHFISIFSEGCDLDHVWTTLQGKLELTRPAIEAKGGDDKIYVDIKIVSEITRSLGGIISIHAGEKSNSIEEIKNREQFQQRIKYDITKNYVDILEIGQIKDIQVYRDIVFPATGLEKPLIICSDNHDLAKYSRKATTWLRSDPTFRGLLMVLREPTDRVFVGDEPDDIIRVRNNPTKIVDSVSFQVDSSIPTGQIWFTSQDVPLNSGLVAIIGNKGSGKSALSDTIGLLGSTKNQSSFSFLSKDRFCHPSVGFAQYFSAQMKFNSGETFIRHLNETIQPADVERVKYLPQDHIEKICNELVNIGDTSFENELKSVIFSHVPSEKRLGQNSIDDLIEFSANEKRRRIDGLVKSLKEVSRSRAHLELQTNPSVRAGIEEKTKRILSEIEAHQLTKPEHKDDPSKSGKVATETGAIISQVNEKDEARKKIVNLIVQKRKELAEHETKRAEASRLIERIENFQKEWNQIKETLNADASNLGISLDDIIAFNVNLKPVKSINSTQSEFITNINLELNSIDPPGLTQQLTTIDTEIANLQSKLDAPNREYQKYRKNLDEWEQKNIQLEGDDNTPESFKGLQKLLVNLGIIPDEIENKRKEQLRISEQIYSEKISLASLYGELYAPVQEFINTHPIAKDKLKLEFKAELVDDGFAGQFLPMIAQNRRGTFLGIEEGKARIDSFIQITNWQAWSSVDTFLTNIDQSLHLDMREEVPTQIYLKDQLIKGKKPEDLFNLIYGLEYLTPRYILRWDEKDLSMLSPGERGTLLLVFYLLIDKGNDPLIIDQPEGNLDNQTVAKVLVDCIKEACRRRQVIIVTHNPNLAVVCDADQVINATLDIQNGNKVEYITGSLENPAMNICATDVLEGTRPAFDIRGSKYEVAK